MILGFFICRDMKFVIFNYSFIIVILLGVIKFILKFFCDVDVKKELFIQYEDCFKGVGCFLGEFYIILDFIVLLVIYFLWRVFEVLCELFKKEFDVFVQ